MKYIDADKLREKIEFAKSVYSNPKRVVHGVADAFMQDGRAAMCDDILKKLDSLQQDHLPDAGEMVEQDHIANVSKMVESEHIADASKMMEKAEVDLEKEVINYFEGYWPGMETAAQCNTQMRFTPPAIMRLVRHFYGLGRNAKRNGV